MSLPDYYSILQVPVTATSAEIKAAYRKLAKIFHPDKNPGNLAAEEKFKQIKDAYENLINPLRRKRYDDKRNRSLTPNNAATNFHKKASAAKKNYSFTEEEAKRRRYYEQHYKKTTYTAPKENKKTEGGLSNELKYILISVPLAVALLLLIIRLYEKPKKEPAKQVVHVGSDIHTGTSPYEDALEKNVFDFNSKKVIKVINNSGHDALVFLHNDSLKTVRHHFIENHYQLFMENVPATNYFVYSWLGDGFNLQKKLFGSIKGDYDATFYVDRIAADIKGITPDTFIVMLLGKNSVQNDSVLLKEIFGKKN